MFQKEFSFGEELKHDDYYSSEKGFGFVDLSCVEGETNNRRQLFGGGFSLRKSFLDEYRVAFEDRAEGTFITKPGHTLVFRIDVPDFGNYRVTLETKASERVTDMSYYLGRRNLVDRDIAIEPAEVRTAEYFTCVSPYIPALESEPLMEKSIYVSINGNNAGISKITVEEASVPTIFVAGDSTLTDQGAMTPYFKKDTCGGWAQELALYLKGAAVCNQAHSGLTTNCFKDDGHLATIEPLIKEGDFFFIQFGHNDQKRRNLAAFGGYKDNMKWYVNWAREKGATPVIVSPISRVPLEDEGEFRSLLLDHSLACKEVANEEKVCFIDLHKISFIHWCQLGVEEAKTYFCHGDITHTNDFGAAYLVNEVVKELRNCPEIRGYLNGKSYKELTPDMETETAPAEVPEGGMFDIEPPYVDIKGIVEYEGLKKAFKQALLDPCVMHLHPYDKMPRAQFFMVYFKALRMNGKRPYEMKYSDIKKYEWDSSYIQAAIEENLIDEETTANNLFRPDEGLTFEELSSLLIRGMQDKPSERDLKLGYCFEKAKELCFIRHDAKPDDKINRADAYIALAELSEALDTGNKALPSDAEIHPVG